jgi:hypothetical protein
MIEYVINDKFTRRASGQRVFGLGKSLASYSRRPRLPYQAIGFIDSSTPPS